MNWIKENIGKVISATALIFSVVGFIIGLYVAEQTISNDLETLKKLHQQDYDYTMRLLRASGAFYNVDE